MSDGTYSGGRGQDTVLEIGGGTFHGGPGTDTVFHCVDSPPADLIDVENVTSQPCTLPEESDAFRPAADRIRLRVGRPGQQEYLSAQHCGPSRLSALGLTSPHGGKEASW